MSNQKLKITVIIAARNEEKMIAPCLESVKWADEILIVDIESSDDTVKIAKRFGTTVISYPWRGYDYAGPRNEGWKKAKGDWILYLDADERVTEELRKEIEIEVRKSQIFSAYAIPRRNFILGKEFKHCGQWPDYVKRLFKKDKFKGWVGKVHEEPKYDGSISHLTNPMIHEKHETIAEMVDKTNSWAEIEAKLMFEANHPPMNIPRFISAMLREFWLRMVKQAAFLDGPEGIIYALYQVFSRFVSYAKLWEMQL